MGLDNIPHVYPCVKAETAIMVTDTDGYERIDCDATIAADQCPWRREAGGRGAAVHGIRGAPCWYRGKAGNWYLEELQEAGYPLTFGDDRITDGFYGDKSQEEDGPHLDPDYCNELAGWMEDHVEAYAKLHATDEDRGRYAIETYRYAAWWLRFVAEKGEGSDVWY